MAGNEIQVLIVEDDPVMRSAFVEMLSNWGFGIRSAQNGLAALLDIRTAKPDILLSDLDMPGMNGYELLSIMRRLHPEMPLIAMSGGYAGAEVPAGVTADAFYAKGAGSCLRLRAILGEISIARLGRGGNHGRQLAFSAV